MKKIKFNWPIIGHKNIVDYLQASLENNKLSHAYLFTGMSGLGKTTVANYFIQSLFCLSEEEVPCGKCLACQQIKKKIHPDVLYLEKEEEKKDITISQIRQLQKFLSLSRLTGKYKVALIQEAELLNKEAANSLLKTIEEPAEKVIIILISENIHQLFPTIVSRCQIIRFYPVPLKIISQFLEKVYSLKKREAKSLANFSEGRPGKIIPFLNPDRFKKYQKFSEIFLDIFKRDFKEQLKAIQELKRQSFFDLELKKNAFLEEQAFCRKIISFLINLLRDLILIKLELFSLMRNYFLKEKLEKIATRYSLKKLIYLIEESRQTKVYLEMNVNPKLAIENLLLNL